MLRSDANPQTQSLSWGALFGFPRPCPRPQCEGQSSKGGLGLPFSSAYLLPQIIILDECTASVDLETDAKIQKTIRTEFSDKTLLTIAHRLLTILSYDRICVMDFGEVVEFGTPLELFQNESGIFRAMVRLAFSANLKQYLTTSPYCSATNQTLGLRRSRFVPLSCDRSLVELSR